MTPIDSPAQVLLAAADLLETEGWGQKMNYNPSTGCRCVYGAIGELTYSRGTDRTDTINAIESLRDYLFTKGPQGHNISADIAKWNDSPNQTAENVIATMRRVAASLDTLTD